MEILENDPEFKKRIENSSLDEIKVLPASHFPSSLLLLFQSGDIAQHLGLVQHHVRTKLDEAKQREMARLRELVGQKIRTMTGKTGFSNFGSIKRSSIDSEKERIELAKADVNGHHMKGFLPQHLDHKNSDTFGQADLERLIQHASKDLDDIDRQREEQFKEYEMRKEYERRAQLSVGISRSKELSSIGFFLPESERR